MSMRLDKKRRLEQAGWRVGDAYDFLDLSKEEREFIETKLALAAGIQKRRQQQKLTQAQLAKRVGSSQSRVAKMEAADPSVSIDLMVRALYGLGANRVDVAQIIHSSRSKTAA